MTFLSSCPHLSRHDRGKLQPGMMGKSYKRLWQPLEADISCGVSLCKVFFTFPLRVGRNQRKGKCIKVSHSHTDLTHHPFKVVRCVTQQSSVSSLSSHSALLSTCCTTSVLFQESMGIAGINLQLVSANIRAWYLSIIHPAPLCLCTCKCVSPWKQPSASAGGCGFQPPTSLLSPGCSAPHCDGSHGTNVGHFYSL